MAMVPRVTTESAHPRHVRPGDDDPRHEDDDESRKDHSRVDDQGSHPIALFPLELEPAPRAVGAHGEVAAENARAPHRGQRRRSPRPTLVAADAVSGLAHGGEAIVGLVTDDRMARLRREYEAIGLVENEMAPDPFIAV